MRAGGAISEADLVEAAAASTALPESDEDDELLGSDADSAADEESEALERRKHHHAGSKLRTVVEEADVVVQVLDARDPAGCRSKEIEDMVYELNKKLVLLLNKTDLVPESSARGWMAHLKREYPTLLFRANTQTQRANLKKAAGSDELIGLLKNYSRNVVGGKSTIAVAVVGPPNVGKSSVINSLKLARAVGTSAQAGSTKKAQHVQIDSKLTLIDTPGVVTDAFQGSPDPTIAALRECLNPVGASQNDPVGCVERLVATLPAEKLMQLYGVSRFASPREFLVQLATRTGKLGKGGVVRVEEAAKRVVDDCASGKLKLFVGPPSSSSSSSSSKAGSGKKKGNGAMEDVEEEEHDDEDEAQVLTELSAEFKFDAEGGGIRL